MECDRFSALSPDERHTLFEALLFCIHSNSGIGFRAYDQSHPDYFDGMEGVTPPNGANKAECNSMFKMLRDLSLHIADEPERLIYRQFGITTWEQFCTEAVTAGKAHGQRPTYTPLYMRTTPKAEPDA